ncbi:hypothetical protein [Lentzea sp. NPDC055074]
MRNAPGSTTSTFTPNGSTSWRNDSDDPGDLTPGERALLGELLDRLAR